MDCNLPGFSVQGIFQARILECVAISFSRGSSQPRDWTPVFLTAGRLFIIWATREAHVYHIYQLNRGILSFWFLITHIYRNWVETTCFLQLCRNSTTFRRYSRFSIQVIMSSMNKNSFNSAFSMWILLFLFDFGFLFEIPKACIPCLVHPHTSICWLYFYF